MKSFIILLAGFLIGLSVNAQSSGKSISGIVKDIQNQPLPGATVSLLRVKDSSVALSKSARDNGRFEFSNLSNDILMLSVSAVGYKKYYSAVLTIDDSRTGIVLPAIILLPLKGGMMKEAVVVAKKPLIEQDIDKTVVNVEAMISSATSNTLEVLERTPGVSVSLEGEINLNNRSVLVLINGRPTYMSGPELAAYLRSLPGAMLDKIELMQNPPAKYDAAGGAVINIRLKRSKVQGYTGSVILGYNQGFTGRTNTSLNLNYLKRSLNVFGNIGYSRDGNYIVDKFERIFYNPSYIKQSSVSLESRYSFLSYGVNGRIGMDYTISPKTTIGVIATINQRPREENSDYTSHTYGVDGELDSAGTGNTTNNFRWEQLSANFNLQHKIDSSGKEITADLNYINYKNTGDQVLTNWVDMTIRPGYLYILPSDVNIYTARVDYSHPMKKKASLSAGLKASLVENDNVSDYFEVVDNVPKPDYDKSNHFLYRENINAVYANGRKDWKRISIQLGLRLENTRIRGEQFGNATVQGSVFKRSYIGLFPNMAIAYKLDSAGKNTLSIEYSKRLNRPGYQQLNPFLFFRDQYTYASGNPYLNPVYNNNVTLTYRYRQYLSIGLQYDRLDDQIINATQAVENIFINRPENIAGGFMVALQVGLNVSPFKWWSINANMAGARFYNHGQVYTEKLELVQYACRLNLFNQFRFQKGWSGEITGNAISQLISWQRIIEPRWRLNAAVQKKVLKGKGSLKLNVEDIFYSWKTEGEIVSLQQAQAFYYNQQDTRRVGIAFTYNFGKESFARKRRYNDNGADDVKGRAEQ